MSVMMRRKVILAAAALLLAACGGGDDTAGSTVPTARTEAPAVAAASTTSVPPNVAPTTDAPTTQPATATSTTSTAPQTTTEPAPTTTVDDGVPDDVQQAYLDAGQPPITADEYDSFSTVCRAFRKHNLAYLQEYDERPEAEQAAIRTNLGPLCPRVINIMDRRSELMKATLTRDGELAVARCIDAYGFPPATYLVATVNLVGVAVLDDAIAACDEAKLQAEVDLPSGAPLHLPLARVALALAELKFAVTAGLPLDVGDESYESFVNTMGPATTQVEWVFALVTD